MTAIEKMAKAFGDNLATQREKWLIEVIANATYGQKNDTPRPEISEEDAMKAALRALIDHIRETGAPEMVARLRNATQDCTEHGEDHDCCPKCLESGLIAALEEVIK